MSTDERVIERLECPTCSGVGIHHGNGEDCDTCRGIGFVHATIRPLVGTPTSPPRPPEGDRRGLDVGDHVTVGKGKASWVIGSFTEYRDGWHAHLETVDGYSHTTVHVDRLRGVTS